MEEGTDIVKDVTFDDDDDDELCNPAADNAPLICAAAVCMGYNDWAKKK